MLFAVGCRDDRPFDSGIVVGTCPVNLGSVLGESLQHYKRDVLFTNRTGSTMNVNFEVTDKNAQFCLCTKAAATAR